MVVVLAAPAADCAPLLVAELLCAIVEMAGGRGGWRLGGWGQEVSERVWHLGCEGGSVDQRGGENAPAAAYVASDDDGSLSMRGGDDQGAMRVHGVSGAVRVDCEFACLAIAYIRNAD